MDGYGNSIKFGSTVGTGAILRVECGFVPKYVKMFNPTDSKKGMIEWIEGMTAAYGIVHQNDAYPQEVTSGGISQFEGVAPGTVLTGTMTITDGAKTLAGVSTAFLTELKVGQKLKIGDQIVEVATITDATTATIVDNADGTESGAKGYDMTGFAPGFILGTDSDMNGAADVLHYMAMR